MSWPGPERLWTEHLQTRERGMLSDVTSGEDSRCLLPGRVMSVERIKSIDFM